MIFGDERRFAIRAEREMVREAIVFGNVNIVVAGEEIGDRSIRVILNTVASEFAGFLAGQGYRGAEEYWLLSPSDAIAKIWAARFGPTDDYDFTNEMAAARYILCPGPGEAFDGFCVVVLEGKETDRVIWRHGQAQSVSFVDLAQSQYLDPLRQFVEWLLPGVHP